MEALTGLTVAESNPSHPQLVRAPRGAPNVLIILLDDTGFAQLGCFGADISTPNIDRLAANGLSYNHFHVTALCSPTRASLLTGRNHHAVGMGFLSDMPMGFPGYTARIPQSAAMLPRLLRDAGWSTMAIGKWHLTPRGERSAAGPFNLWPTGVGFERYYGVLHGGANYWTPNLVSDNHYIDPPATYEEGYHLSADLADQVIRTISDQKSAAPEKPFFCYYAEAATHAPHQVDQRWSEPYAGRYDDGWEGWRERTFARQLESGIVPEGTRLTERPPWVQEWDGLDDDAQRLFARMHEIYAGFVSHTDAQIGRVIDHLRLIGELDNTIVMLCSDNGASAEGGHVGSINEHRFTKGLRESVEANFARIDEFGGPRSYNHYAWGWAWAGNTPFRLWKRYAWLGGTRTPLVVHWPSGIAASGEVRSQFCHVVDLMPTLLDLCGVDVPTTVDGVRQLPVDGRSLASTFEDSEAPSPRGSQYFEVQGSRAMYADGWKATTNHVGTAHGDEIALIPGSHAFAGDHWALFNLHDDFSEADDISADHPEKVAELEAAWWKAAEANNVLPLDDGYNGRLPAISPPAYPQPTRVVYRPGAGPVADEVLPLLCHGFSVTAELTVGPGGAEGIIAALGDWSSGFALYALDGHLIANLCLSGDQFKVSSPDPVPRAASLGCRYEPTSPTSGRMEVLVDGTVVGSLELDRSLPVSWQNGGTGLRIGLDAGFPVCDDYSPPFAWTGTIRSVEVAVSDPRPADLGQVIAESLNSD